MLRRMFSVKLFTFLFIGVIFFCATHTTFAANPTTPISPADNIQDPGDPSTPWGGCAPTDSNCYVATPWSNNGDDIYFNGGNVGIGTDTPEAKLHVNGTLKVTGSSSLADITPDVAASTTSGVVKTTITTDDLGYGMGMAKGADGFARIAYVDYNTYALKYVVCNDADCSSPTTTEVVSETYGGYPGSDILALGSDGFARILYEDANDGHLNMVRCLDEDCTTKNINVIDPDDTNLPGYYGMAIVMGDDGFPRISAQESDNSEMLRFTLCNDADCSSPTTTDISGTYNYQATLAIGSDHFARLVYLDYNDYFLKLARCTDAACSSPVITAIDSGSNYPGYYGVVARFGSDGFLRVAYVDDDTYSLWYAVCNDIDCTSPTINQLELSDGYTSNGIGFNLRTGNLPSISYETTGGGTNIINCTTSTCSAYNDVAIDTIGMSAGGPLLIGDDNLPIIAYSDEDTAIKFARLNVLDGEDVVAGNDIGSSGARFKNIYGKTINADHIVLNGSEFTGGPWTTSGSDIYFNTGNVGIGTTSPGSALDVRGTIRASSANGTTVIGFVPQSSLTGTYLEQTFYGTSVAAFPKASIRGGSNGSGMGYLAFGVAGGASNSTTLDTPNALYIEGTAGNVGIGTATPGYKLEVNGSLKAGGASVIGTGSTGVTSLTVNASTGDGIPVLRVNNEGGENLFSIGSTFAGGTLLNSTEVTVTNTLNVGSKLQLSAQQLSVRADQADPSLSKLTVKAGDAVYGDRAGGDLDIKSGAGAGAGDGGSINFFTSLGIASSGVTNTQLNRMTILPSGLVGIGTTSPEAKLEVAGSGCFDTVADTHCTAAGVAGDIYYGTAHANWTDIAEKYPSVETLEPGDVVMLDTASIEGSSIFKPYITKAQEGGRVMGVISEHPGLVLGDDYGKSEDYSLALSGRVPVKVTDENGTIKAGDRLTLSLTQPGYAMKQTEAGQSFGIALEPQADNDTVLMFVDLSYQSLADLDLEGSDTPVIPDGGMLSIVSSWLSDAGNGIAKIFAGEVNTKKLCVSDEQGETCITRGQLDALLNNSSGSTGGSSPEPSDPTPPPSNPEPEPTPPPETVSTPEGDVTPPATDTPTDSSETPPAP